MGFGIEFNKTFEKGLGLGVANYQADQKRRLDIEEETQKRITEANKKNAETKAYADLLGVPYDVDPVTGEFKVNVPKDYTFKTPSPSLQASLFPEMGNEFQQAYNMMEKEYKASQKPPVYVGKKSSYDPETKMGIVTGIDPKTNSRVQIGVDPYYKPRKTQSDVIEGVVEVNGQKFGTAGRRTRLMTFEDGTYQTQDLGKVKSGSGGKSTSEMEFELKVADLEEKVTNTKQKRQTYLTKKFADPEARDEYRDGINAELNEIALSYGKMGSPVAQKEILTIFKDGKDVIKKENNIDRKKFYEEKKNKVEQEYISGEWDHRDATAIMQFLDAKYNLYLPYEDAKREEDEINFDELSLDLE